MVEHTSRRAYDDMCFLRQFNLLRGERLLAEQGHGLDPFEASDVGNILFNLCGELACRCQYKHLRLILCPVH
ncbi:hypothetical protein D3C76_1474280 [compost metagenome]